MTLILYKGRKRQLHIGKKGGKYLLIQGKKRYLKPKSDLSKKSSSQTKKPGKRKVMKGGAKKLIYSDIYLYTNTNPDYDYLYDSRIWRFKSPPYPTEGQIKKDKTINYKEGYLFVKDIEFDHPK